MFDFKEHILIVTGADSGIGRATADYFHRCGANVVLEDINEASIDAVAWLQYSGHDDAWGAVASRDR
jgi:3-oxoacyl-[acyl-carrier protein] reductase